MGRFTGIIGLLVLLGLAWAMSSHRRRVSLRIVLGGIGLQFILAWALLRFEPIVDAFDRFAEGVNTVIGFAGEGARFVFGNLSDGQAGPWGFVFATQVLPTIVFFASLMAVLYHLGVMQVIIRAMAWVMRRTMRVTGVESLAMAANVFVGQTEAPLCVKPYIESMTRSQLMALMVGGFATIAGSVLAIYVGMLGGDDPAQRVLFIKHLLTASVLSAPAAFVVAKIVIPETEDPVDEGLGSIKIEKTTRNVLDAAAAGASDGMRLALNVGAMLVAFVALLALCNWPVRALGDWGPIKDWLMGIGVLSAHESLDIQTLIGALLMPLAWVMGVPWHDCANFGSLLGEKLVLTEFLAYISLADLMHDPTGPGIGDRSAQIAAYALCGFANFPSIAIQIGGLTGIAPGRRSDFASLGMRAMFGGAIASWMTASIAGMFIAG